MGGKSGGGADAGPMLQYGNKALALQEKIYNEGKAANAPYQAAGGAGLNELMMRLGLGGGNTATARTEQQIRTDLMPSYTSQSTAPTNFYKTRDGKLIDISTDQRTFENDFANAMPSQQKAIGYSGAGIGGNELSRMTQEDRAKYLANMGYSPFASSSPTTDTNGLNSAVQKALAEQEAAAGANRSNPLYGSLLDTFGMDNYQADPGYQFRLSEGNKALDRSLAASGQYMTPQRQIALQQYGQGMASEEYGNAYNRFNQDQGNIYNRLAGITGIGQTALSQNQQAGQQYGQSASDLYTGMGNSIVAANQARQANKGSMFNTLLGAGAQLGGAYLMSDRRLKEDIEHIGEENGFPIYKFRYIGQSSPLIGVMSDDVKKIKPEAVIQDSQGYDRVNYDMIGVKFRSAGHGA